MEDVDWDDLIEELDIAAWSDRPITPRVAYRADHEEWCDVGHRFKPMITWVDLC